MSLSWQEEVQIADVLARTALRLDSSGPRLEGSSGALSAVPADTADGTFHLLHNMEVRGPVESAVVVSTYATTLRLRHTAKGSATLDTFWHENVDTLQRDRDGRWTLARRRRESEWSRTDVVEVVHAPGQPDLSMPDGAGPERAQPIEEAVDLDQIRVSIVATARALDRGDAGLMARVADVQLEGSPPNAIGLVHRALGPTAVALAGDGTAVALTSGTWSWRDRRAEPGTDHVAHFWWRDRLSRRPEGTWVVTGRERLHGWSYRQRVQLERPAPTDSYAVAAAGALDPSYSLLDWSLTDR